MRRTLPLLLLCLAPMACAQPAAPGPADRSVATTGTGRVEAAPDRARIRAQATALAVDSAAARNAVDAQIAAARAALVRLGYDEDALRANSLRIQPEYSYQDRERHLTGYRATRDLAVLLTDLERAGEVLDALLASGLPEVSGIGYELSAPAELRDEARALAVADARRKAEQLAAELGARLGPVRHIQQGGGAPPPSPARMVMAAEADTGYRPDDLSVSETVSVVFDLIVD